MPPGIAATTSRRPCASSGWPDLYVSPAARRRGGAQALVAALVALGRELGVGEIVWNVEPENAPALAFYERIGARAWTRNRIMYLKLDEYRP